MGDSTHNSYSQSDPAFTKEIDPETVSIDDTVDEDGFEARLEAVLGRDAVRALKDISGPGPSVTYQLTGKATQELEPEVLAFLEESDEKPTQFTPLDTLGEGGMGIVHLAAQEIPSRYVAIKTLKKFSAERAEQLFAEAMLTGSLEHPNIIPVHAIHIDKKRGPEVVMKKVEGISMREAYDKAPHNEASLRTFLQALIKVCYALEYAHAQGVIHRDIKPDNIMLGEFGEVYLMDWGIAIDTRRVIPPRRGLVGTPHFLAPEMITGDPGAADARTDVYLLGATLHYFLVGRPRHDKTRVMSALVKAQLSAPVVYPAEVFPELGDLANGACARKPDDRPQTVAEFREAIEKCLEHWEAVKMVQRIQPHVDVLTGPDLEALPLAQRLRHYDAATSGLESAILIWPDFTAANERLWAVRETMLQSYAEADQPDLASAIHGKLAEDYPEQDKILDTLKSTIEGAAIRKKRISLQVAANDLAPSTRGRRRAAIAMVVLVTIICSVMGYFEYRRLVPRSAFQGLIVWLVGCAGFALILFTERKNFMANEAGRRVLIPLICGPAIVLIIRMGVYFRGLDPLESMGGECLVLGFACATMTPAFPNGPKLGLVAMGFGILAFVMKDFAYTAFVGTCLVCSAGLAWEWMGKGGALFATDAPSIPDGQEAETTGNS